MLTKAKIALTAMLVVGSASLAAAQEADPILLNRYPAYNGVVAGALAVVATPGFETSAVKLERRSRLRTAPVRLQDDVVGYGASIPQGGNSHVPGAFFQQVQPGFPQSPPGGA